MEHSASSDDWEGEGASSDEGDVPGGAARRHIYNAEALHEKLEDIAWVEEQPWEEGLVVTAAAPTRVDDVDDDLQRELAFYNQVWAAAGLHSLQAQHLCVHTHTHTRHFNFTTAHTYAHAWSTAWSSTCAHSSRPEHVHVCVCASTCFPSPNAFCPVSSIMHMTHPAARLCQQRLRQLRDSVSQVNPGCVQQTTMLRW